MISLLPAKNKLPTEQLTIYVVRHGERIDHIDDNWTRTSTTPYDPPLTADGYAQARKAGTMIRDLEPQTDTEYIVLTSPFLRCAQTGEAIHEGFCKESNPLWRVAVEPGLSEVINENYFHSADNVPTGIVAERREEMRTGVVCANMVFDEGYHPACEGLPVFPENFQSMLVRYGSVLDHIATGAISERKGRQVVVLVTHGAGITALRWATTRRLETGNDVPYCALFKASIGSTPELTWTVNALLSPNL
ncbi:hypothetical protein GGI08_000899 [Coemansia sp. S2]|nr:hypothetical protein GGI08_000899 [Coemansia sp. S2]KAJ2074309.1 hypothetical protein GGH13_001415 [Coemansia sp. S155-1]